MNPDLDPKNTGPDQMNPDLDQMISDIKTVSQEVTLLLRMITVERLIRRSRVLSCKLTETWVTGHLHLFLLKTGN